LVLRFSGPAIRLSPDDRRKLIERTLSVGDDARAAARAAIAEVGRDGDAALIRLAFRYDGARLSSVAVPRDAIETALAGIPTKLRNALERAAANIERVHKAFAPRCVETETEPGIRVGRRPDPLARVGLYAPGGTAAYPSSVLMTAIPARVAGVADVILCTPPSADGLPSRTLLAAAALAGIDRVFAVGGAGAIAAMALGTESIPRVDKIMGPGNAFVMAAKLEVAGTVAIDSPAGPSELLVLADETSDPRFVASEMVAQAEHDPDASVVAAVTNAELARAVELELARLASVTPRGDIVRQALAAHGAVLTFEDMAQAVSFANDYAAEHLLIATTLAQSLLPSVRNAACVFLGARSSVSFGDYSSGANHVLPTGGKARMYSGLSTLDFVRWTSYQEIDADAAELLAEDTATLAEAEGLPAHAAAARFAGSAR
jgi:histidinol dehydrogenase